MSHERLDIAGAESFIRSKATCGAAMRGAVALPGSIGVGVLMHISLTYTAELAWTPDVK